MGTIERAPAPRQPRSITITPWRIAGAVGAVLLGVVGYQQATRPKEKEPPRGWLIEEMRKRAEPKVVYVVEKEKPDPPKSQVAEVLPSSGDPPAGPAEVIHESVQDVPITRPPNAAAVLPAAPAKELAPKNETFDAIAARCLEFSGEIADTGPVIHPASAIVEMHVTNRCPDNFPGQHVWATAMILGRDSGIVGSDFGHFEGTIHPYGQASTRMEIECDPDLARSVQVKLRYFQP
jgi:hypothetical protein